MVNHFSCSLLAMALFSGLSLTLGWPVVSYPLFASGIAAVALTDDTVNRGRLQACSTALLCVALTGLGFLGGPTPALVLIVPVAALAVFSAGVVFGIRHRRGSAEDKHIRTPEDPLTSLYVSLPSAVALIAILALA